MGSAAANQGPCCKPRGCYRRGSIALLRGGTAGADASDLAALASKHAPQAWDAELVVACYLWLLENRDLAPKEWEHVRGKLREANQRVVETDETRVAAMVLQRVGRQQLARYELRRRQQQRSAARLITAVSLRKLQRLGRGATPLATHVVLLRMPLAAVVPGRLESDEHAWRGAEVVAAYTHARRSPPVNPEALAPFASLALPASDHAGCPLAFVLTTRQGLLLYGTAVKRIDRIDRGGRCRLRCRLHRRLPGCPAHA